jgi:hypothetical protein
MATDDQNEERLVADWLRRAAHQESLEARGRRLPSAGHLWWKAQIIRKLVERDRMAERATRPARWSQWAGLGLACVLMTLFAAWLGYGLFSQLDAETLPRLVVGLFVAGTVLPLVGFAVFWTMWRDV